MKKYSHLYGSTLAPRVKPCLQLNMSIHLLPVHQSTEAIVSSCSKALLDQILKQICITSKFRLSQQIHALISSHRNETNIIQQASLSREILGSLTLANKILYNFHTIYQNSCSTDQTCAVSPASLASSTSCYIPDFKLLKDFHFLLLIQKNKLLDGKDPVQRNLLLKFLVVA